MRSYLKKAAALTLAGALVCGSLAGCGKKADTKIDGTKPLMTVNGETLNLGVGSFFARFQQAEIYQIYTAYFGATTIFDQTIDETTGQLYGDNIKESILEDLKKDMVIRQHAEEYGVSLTDEEKQAIEDAAQEYMDENSEEVRNLIGAGKEDLVELMTLQTIQSKMMDPIVKDVDTEVSDEEGQVSSLTYITVNVPTEEDVTSGAESALAAVEPVADAVQSAAADAVEAIASSGAESVAEEVAETSLQLTAKAKAQSVIDAILAAGAAADADLEEIAKTVDDSLTSSNGQFTTYHTEDATVDAAIVDAVKDLEDGTLLDTPVRSEDGSEYYVVRLDKVYDEELTADNKASVVVTRKQELYTETVDKWVEEAEIKVEDENWKAIVLTDSKPFTLAPHDHDHEEEAESAAESMVVDVESIAEPVESAVMEAISVVENAASTVEEAAGAAADALSTAE